METPLGYGLSKRTFWEDESKEQDYLEARGEKQPVARVVTVFINWLALGISSCMVNSPMAWPPQTVSAQIIDWGITGRRYAEDLRSTKTALEATDWPPRVPTEAWQVEFERCWNGRRAGDRSGKGPYRFIIIPLGLFRREGSHQNAIVVDVARRSVERYDPHGSQSAPYFRTQVLDDLLGRYFNRFGLNYEAIPAACPTMGLQAFEGLGTRDWRLLGDYGLNDSGYCVFFTLLYLYWRLSPDFRNMSSGEAQAEILEMFYSEGEAIGIYIRKFATWVLGNIYRRTSSQRSGLKIKPVEWVPALDKATGYPMIPDFRQRGDVSPYSLRKVSQFGVQPGVLKPRVSPARRTTRPRSRSQFIIPSTTVIEHPTRYQPGDWTFWRGDLVQIRDGKWLPVEKESLSHLVRDMSVEEFKRLALFVPMYTIAQYHGGEYETTALGWMLTGGTALSGAEFDREGDLVLLEVDRVRRRRSPARRKSPVRRRSVQRKAPARLRSPVRRRSPRRRR